MADAVVFIHFGWSDYLRHSLGRASAAAAGRPVYLIGDRPPPADVTGIRFVPMDSLAPGWQRFVASYRHLSTQPYAAELRCWQRWWLLLALQEREAIRTVLHLDSDALLFAPPPRIAPDNLPHGFALCVPSWADDDLQWAASGHCSVWSLDALRGFCDFATTIFDKPTTAEVLARKWAWHQERRLPGGVTDMSGLYLFWAGHGRPTSLTRARSEGVVDDNLNTTSNFLRDEYIGGWRHKSLAFLKGGGPLLLPTLGGRIPVLVLHCQGVAKPIMGYLASPGATSAGYEWRIHSIHAWYQARGLAGRVARSMGLRRP
jgi:hypothetical protein